MVSLRGLYLTKPHSALIADGRKSIIVRGDDQDLSNLQRGRVVDAVGPRKLVHGESVGPGDPPQGLAGLDDVADNLLPVIGTGTFDGVAVEAVELEFPWVLTGSGRKARFSEIEVTHTP